MVGKWAGTQAEGADEFLRVSDMAPRCRPLRDKIVRDSSVGVSALLARLTLRDGIRDVSETETKSETHSQIFKGR